jgi:uncharacterized protein YqjF (DUF2071 family)
MTFIQRILKLNDHRPYPMPRRPWKYYQEWHDVLFAHWKVPLKPLRELVPQGLDIDLFEGEAWVSLVAFEVKKLRPHFIPSFPPISDFLEINMRTYVTRHGKSGIYCRAGLPRSRASCMARTCGTCSPTSHRKRTATSSSTWRTK